MHILYIEDDLKIQVQTIRILNREGHQVTAFADAPHALDFARKTQPEMVLCDFRLEGSPNGLALAAQVRRLYPACPIVMISSYTTAENVSEALELDIDAYVMRPIAVADLLDKLYSAVERRRDKHTPGLTRIISNALVLDMLQRVAIWYGERLDLTPTEFGILHHLVTKPNQVCPPVDLWAATTGVRLEREAARLLLKPHLSALRAKLGQHDKYPVPIQNVRGQGYRWLESDQAVPSEPSH